MNPKLIFWPLIIQFLLILWMFYRLGIVKKRAVIRGDVDLSVTATNNDAWPEYVRKVSNNIRNQFQLPVMFGLIVLALFALKAVDTAAIILAFVFVGSRLVHAYIHTGANYVPNRTRVFQIGYFAIIGLLALLIRAVA